MFVVCIQFATSVMRLRLLRALKGAIARIHVEVKYRCSFSVQLILKYRMSLYRMFKTPASRVVSGNSCVVVVPDPPFECLSVSIEGLESEVFSV